MKRRIFITLSLTASLLCSCYTEIESQLELLERRIESAAQSVEKLQTNINSLKTLVDALNARDFVVKVTENRSLDGTVEGYTIYFTHSDPVTICNGNDAGTPVIGVELVDGVYYWTVTDPDTGVTEFLENGYGQMVPATALTPKVKIVNGYWMVCYDEEEEVWENLGKATGDTPDSFIKSVSDSTDFWEIVYVDGTSVRIPSWGTYEKIVQECETAARNCSQLDSLRQVIASKVYANDIIPIVSGTDTIGYKLCFSDGRELSFYDGISTNRPVIAAHRDTAAAGDSTLYWCIRLAGSDDYDWLTISGYKIKASAVAADRPLLGIRQAEDNLYYWTVSYDGGTTYDYILCGGDKVLASAVTNARVVDSVVVSGGSIAVTVGEETWYIPRFNDFAVSFSPISNNTVKMDGGTTVSFTCRVASGDGEYSVLPVTSDGFYATAVTDDWQNWTITLTAPAEFISSRLDLIVSDGRGTTKTFEITITRNE